MRRTTKQKGTSTMKVTIHFKDGEDQVFAAERAPWQWSDFLCVRVLGRVATHYFPIDDVSSFEVVEAAA